VAAKAKKHEARTAHSCLLSLSRFDSPAAADEAARFDPLCSTSRREGKGRLISARWDGKLSSQDRTSAMLHSRREWALGGELRVEAETGK
jgi:hypothetical protein